MFGSSQRSGLEQQKQFLDAEAIVVFPKAIVQAIVDDPRGNRTFGSSERRQLCSEVE